MDEFKIDFFLKDFPEYQFPSFRSLSVEELHAVECKLGKKTGFVFEKDSVLWNYLLHRSVFLPSVDPESPLFRLEDFLIEQEFLPSEEVIIVWMHSGEGDIISIRDLDSYFQSIWYSTNDMTIISSDFKWIVFVLHYGVSILILD